jgi:TPR repeat protein
MSKLFRSFFVSCSLVLTSLLPLSAAELLIPVVQDNSFPAEYEEMLPLLQQALKHSEAGNEEKAVEIYEELCSRKFYSGCINLATILYKGSDKLYDPIRARKLYTESCRPRFSKACYLLVIMVLHEEGGDSNTAVLGPILKNSCDSRDLGACHLFASYLFAHQKKSGGLAMARQYFGELCALDYPDSCTSFSSMIFWGQGGKKDKATALRNFQKICLDDPESDACDRSKWAATEPNAAADIFM